MQLTDVTDNQIRAYLGHGEGSRRVRIARAGRREVTVTGSRCDTDRSQDSVRQWMGTREDCARDVVREHREHQREGY